VSDWKAYTVIGTNVVIDCGTVEEAIAYERELWANQPYAPPTPAPLDDDGWQERGNPGDDATPAPLDAALCDCGDGYPSYGIGKRKHLPSCHYGIIADWLDQPAPTPLAPHPGENHEYDMTCRRCGEPGYLFVGFHSPGETFRWSEAQPKEAE